MAQDGSRGPQSSRVASTLGTRVARLRSPLTNEDLEELPRILTVRYLRLTGSSLFRGNPRKISIIYVHIYYIYVCVSSCAY